MIAKQYLNQIGNLEEQIASIDLNVQRIRKELDEIEDIGLSSSWGDGQPHGRKIGDPTGRKASQLADMSNKIRDKLQKDLRRYEAENLQLRKELWQKRMEIITTLEKVIDPEDPMSKTYHRILILRYCERMSWERIAIDIGYTWRHTIRLHGTALKKLEAIINE